MTDGIQSLLLGGGYGFLTGQHGLVIDNLLKVCPPLPALPDSVSTAICRPLLLRQMGPLSQLATPKMRAYSGPSAEEVQISVSARNMSSDYIRNAALSLPALSSSQQSYWMT